MTVLPFQIFCCLIKCVLSRVKVSRLPFKTKEIPGVPGVNGIGQVTFSKSIAGNKANCTKDYSASGIFLQKSWYKYKEVVSHGHQNWMV